MSLHATEHAIPKLDTISDVEIAQYAVKFTPVLFPHGDDARFLIACVSFGHQHRDHFVTVAAVDVEIGV
jgi:hypothetical protein